MGSVSSSRSSLVPSLPQPVPQAAIPSPPQHPNRTEHLPEWCWPVCVHPPPCLVPLRLIIELRLGCSPSHPDIQRRDPPPASCRLLLGCLSPPTLSLLLHLLNSILSPADFSYLWSLLSILQIVTSLGFQVPSSQKFRPLSSSLSQAHYRGLSKFLLWRGGVWIRAAKAGFQP